MSRGFSDEVNRHAGLLVCLALILVTMAVYWPVKDYGFIGIDDDQYVTHNTMVIPGLTTKGLREAFSLDTEPYWHPLTWISHMLDTELYGLNPRGHHWNNLLLHILNTLLLFMLLKILTGSIWCSGAVALLFAIHPLNVESVVWVASRKNLLGAFWGLLSLLCYSRYVTHPGFVWYGALLISFGLGLMAKPMLVTLPFLLLMIDIWPLGRLNLKFIQPSSGSFLQKRGIYRPAPFRVILEKAPLALLSIASVLVSILAAQGRNILISREAFPVSLRIENGLVSLVTYASKMIWPSDLAFFHPYPDSIPNWESIGSGVLIFALSLVFIFKSRRAPFLLVGWAWYLITLLPVIGIVQQGIWPAWADRFAYIPLVGLFMVVVWALSSLSWGRHRIRIAVIAGSLVAVSLLGISSRHQILYWGNDERLFRRAVEVAPPNHLAHFNLGAVLVSQGKIEEALTHYSRAVDILPLNPLFHYGLGSALIKQGAFEEAALHLERAVELSPSYAEARTNLAVALAGLGRTEMAILQLRKAIEIRPLAEAYHNLGIIHAGQGRYQEAVSSYQSALRFSPSDPMIHNDLGVALYSLGNFDQAVNHLSESLRLGPGNTKVYENLRFVLEQAEKEKSGKRRDRPESRIHSQSEDPIR